MTDGTASPSVKRIPTWTCNASREGDDLNGALREGVRLLSYRAIVTVCPRAGSNL